MFSILANSETNKEEYQKKIYIKIQYIRWDSNLIKDNTFSNQRLRPLSHADILA